MSIVITRPSGLTCSRTIAHKAAQGARQELQDLPFALRLWWHTDRYGEDTGKGAKKMEENIADLVEDDPNFVSRLHTQLKKLAKS